VAGTEPVVTTAPAGRLAGDERAAPDLHTLVDHARGGDAAAWEALYRLLYPRLLSYARRHLDPERARDAVSEAMARAVSGIGRFEWKGAGFEGWLFGILRHVILDVHRQLGRRAVAAMAPAGGADVADVAEGLLAHEEAGALRAAFARLRPDEQELLHLRVVAGLGSDDVAAVLGKRPGAVRMAQARALGRLRRYLEEAGQ